jgi:hypothetical protein
VNIGVGRGLIAGANLRPAEKKTIREESSSHTPGLATHGDRLLIAWKGAGNDNVSVARVEETSLFGIDGVEGIEWKRILGITSDVSPVMASHNDRLYLAWKGSGNNQLNLAFSEDQGLSFAGTMTFGDSSEFQPSLASHNGRLYMAWTGEGNEKVNVAKVALFANTAGGFGIDSLEEKVVLGDTSEGAPALASHNGHLFVAWKGSGNDALNLALSSDNGATFGGKRVLPESSSHGPALASHEGRLFLAWKGSGNESLNVARVVLIGNTAGAFGIEGLEAKAVLGETSDEPPALASHKGQLFLAWKGEDEEFLNIRLSRDGMFGTPGPWFISNLAEPLGMYIAAYRTPPGRPPEDNDDSHLDSLGFVYAMEAADMPFDQFRGLILERNNSLPAQLEYGGTYEFQAPDNKRFSIWFWLTEQKYRARVVEISEPNPVQDFGAQPLVEGPYLTAPGRHDGLIEIRHPGCEQWPVVLDFRDARNPVRTDNKADCPEPWVERVQALSAIARRFDEQSRTNDARTARADAAQLYGELVRLNPEESGPLMAPTVIEALAAMGVDFSVPESDLRDWLANPEFTPYPAISQALLRSGWRLKSPVYLDVIVFNYEDTPGVMSPRELDDVDPDVLKDAILEGYNVRYDMNISDFGQIILP